MTDLQKQYIDENYLHEPISMMIPNINLTYLQILTYYKSMGYEPLKKRGRRYDKKIPSGYFDIDNYKPETI